MWWINIVRVLLIQIDGKLPNVALMRIAAHHRALGDDVVLVRACVVIDGTHRRVDTHPFTPPPFDKIYASSIFERSKELVDGLRQKYPDAIFGGTGVDKTITLEQYGVTTIRQDYSIFPNYEHSIGFSQRGCRLKCSFCVVPEKEGKNRTEQSIADLWRGDPHPRNLLLLDNDFFGQPDWRERAVEIISGKFKVCFSQGINCRLIDDEAAEYIGRMKIRDDSFTTRRIYTAWDNLNDEKRLFAGLHALKRNGVKPREILVYMLTGYWPGETEESREYRRAKLREFGARPYPMPYVRAPHTKCSCEQCELGRELVGAQRFCVGGYDKRFTWQHWKAAGYRPEKLHLVTVEGEL